MLQVLKQKGKADMVGKTYFNAVAGKWDEMRLTFFSENVRTCAIQNANVEQGKVAVDLGAGTGFLTEALIAKGLKVIAIDNSAEMLRVLRSKFGEYNNIEFREGDAESIPLADETADYLFMNMCLHHVERPEVAMREIFRILKNGGRVTITDLDEHNFKFLRTEHHDRWMGFQRDAIVSWLEAAQFKDISIGCVGENCCAKSACGCTSATISIFIASAVRAFYPISTI